MIVLKTLFVTGLIGMSWGCWRGKRDFGDWQHIVFGAMLGSSLGSLATIFAAGIVYGVYWLFTA